MAPIQQIPFDLLSEIFLLCTIAKPLAPMVIASVNHTWRQTILATPIAWSRIFMHFPDAIVVPPAYVSIFMTRSDPCLLHVGLPARVHRRPDDKCDRSNSYCNCPDVRLLLKNSHRIQCLTIDASWFEEFSQSSYPNLHQLRVTDSRRTIATIRLRLSDFPGLQSLDICAWKCKYFDLSSLPPSRMDHFSVQADKHGYWDKLTRSYAETLHTLRLFGPFRMVNNPKWTFELPMLKSLLINERSDRWKENLSPPVFEINAPALTVLSLILLVYKSPQDGLRIIHKGTIDNLRYIWTNRPIQLRSYSHLHVIYVSNDYTIFEDIVGQLEGDVTLCPYLATIDLMFTNILPGGEHDHLKERLETRNGKAGSSITVTFGLFPSVDMPEFHPRVSLVVPMLYSLLKTF